MYSSTQVPAIVEMREEWERIRYVISEERNARTDRVRYRRGRGGDRKQRERRTLIGKLELFLKC